MSLIFRTFLFFYVIMIIAYASNIPSIGIRETKRLWDSHKVIVIDVREESELKDGIVQGAIVLPMSKMSDNPQFFEREISLLPKDKTIIVYCASGRRAGIVGAELEKRGYRVLNMGGFNSWKKAGFPVESKE